MYVEHHDFIKKRFKMFNKNLTSIAFFMMLFGAISAQVNPYLKEVISNRIKTDVQQFTQYVSEGQINDVPKLTNEKYETIESRNNDLFVNATPEPESEFHAAINPKDTNNIIICSMRNNPSNFLAPLTFPIYYTKDFGATWNLSQFDGTKAGEFILGGGDPILVFDTEGVAYLCWLTLTTNLTLTSKIALKYASSKDGGATWTTAAKPLDEGNAGNLLDILAGNVSGNIKFVDKEWLAVDRSNSPYRNTIYASYLTIEAQNNIASTKITLRKKSANSEEFSSKSIVVHENDYKLVQFTSIDVDNKGTVHITFAGTPDSLNWSFYYVQSKDGGETFTPEMKITDFHLPRLSADEPIGNIVGIDEARIYPCPQLAIDKSNGIHEGTLYYVWTANGITKKEAAGLDIYFTCSKDGGSTWEVPSVLNDDGLKENHQFYPSIAVNEQGKIIVSWYDRREDIDNINTSYYMTYSLDGGDSFIPNFAVSSKSSDFSIIGSKNGAFGIGEYTQTLSTPYFAIPIWSDGRTNDGNIDIYLAFVPFDGASTVTTIKTVAPTVSIVGPTPNPFHQSTEVQLYLKSNSKVVAQLYNTDGKLVKTIVNTTLAAGTHSLQLNGLSRGEYILTIQTEKSYISKKLISK
jgi:hypothetical protein